MTGEPPRQSAVLRIRDLVIKVLAQYLAQGKCSIRHFCCYCSYFSFHLHNKPGRWELSLRHFIEKPLGLKIFIDLFKFIWCPELGFNTTGKLSAGLVR